MLECNLCGLWMHDKCVGVNANSYKTKNKPWQELCKIDKAK